jgi:hypothetical protein
VSDEKVVTKRPVNLFDVPQPLAGELGIGEVGLVTLTSDEELQCYARGKTNSAKLAAELAKASLVEVNGEKVGLADGSVDTAWGKMDPRLRQLVLTAYTEIHAAKEEDTATFLKSRRVRVG